ncbi:MAG: hypothetical protein JSS22_11590 [Proteobacteria bacterium]|nr:hypothetical protein [Pseudomonadota bacterium]
MMPANRDLDVDEVLDRCKCGIPVNVRMDVAINAHCLANLAGDRQVTAYALRTVILARTPDVSDLQSQIDYLAGLPREAWDVLDFNGDARTATLDAIRRSIAWMQAA